MERATNTPDALPRRTAFLGLAAAVGGVGLVGLAVESVRVGLLLAVDDLDATVAAGALLALGTAVAVLAATRRTTRTGLLLAVAGLASWLTSGALGPVLAGPTRAATASASWPLVGEMLVVPVLASVGIVLVLVGAAAASARGLVRAAERFAPEA